MKMTKILGLALAAAGMMTITAQATPIVGGISLTGGFTPNNPDLTAATSLALSPLGGITGISGSYVGVGITPFVTSVAWSSPLVFDPPTAAVPLWNVGAIASFDLTSFYEVAGTTSDSLELRGTGLLHLAGFSDTPGTWLATFNTAGGTFSFSSSNGAVPDGGGTLILLGSAVMGLFSLGRKSLRNA